MGGMVGMKGSSSSASSSGSESSSESDDSDEERTQKLVALQQEVHITILPLLVNFLSLFRMFNMRTIILPVAESYARADEEIGRRKW